MNNELTPRAKFIKAVKENDLDTVQDCLIREKVSRNIRIDGKTALHIAFENNNQKLFKLLLIFNADYKLKNTLGQDVVQMILESPLEKALCYLSLMLEVYPQNTELQLHYNNYKSKQDSIIYEPFFAAVKEGNIIEVTNYLSRGFSPNMLNAEKDTPLHISIENNHLELSKLLINHGANIGIKGALQLTPLQLIYLNKMWDLIPIAAARGEMNQKEIINYERPDFNNLLNLATIKKRPRYIEMALEFGDIDLDKIYSSMMRVIAQNDITTLNLLIKHRAAVIYNESQGRPSPLKALATQNKWPIILMILKDVEVNQAYREQWAFIFNQAYDANQKEIIEELLCNGIFSPAAITTAQKEFLYKLLNENNELFNKIIKNGHGKAISSLFYNAVENNNQLLITKFLQHKIAPSSFLLQPGGEELMLKLYRSEDAERLNLVKTCYSKEDIDNVNSKLLVKAIEKATNDSRHTEVILLLQAGIELPKDITFTKKIIIYINKLVDANEVENIEQLKKAHKGISNYLNVMNYFEDGVITFTQITEPYIIPQGTTYDKITIRDANNTDPQTREPLAGRDIVPNSLVWDLLIHYLKSDTDINQIPPCLICSQTQKLFKQPVVAVNGKTYEKAWLEDFLKENESLTPDNQFQHREAYPNRLIAELIEEKYKNLPQDSAEPPTSHLAQLSIYSSNKRIKTEHNDANESMDFEFK